MSEQHLRSGRTPTNNNTKFGKYTIFGFVVVVVVVVDENTFFSGLLEYSNGKFEVGRSGVVEYCDSAGCKRCSVCHPMRAEWCILVYWFLRQDSPFSRQDRTSIDRSHICVCVWGGGGLNFECN